jgi:hypothetical protein
MSAPLWKQQQANLDAIFAEYGDEAMFVLKELEAGRISGLEYGHGNQCACLFGTIGRAKRWGNTRRRYAAAQFSGSGWTSKYGYGPMEVLFLKINPGDRPATNGHARRARRLILLWIARNRPSLLK